MPHIRVFVALCSLLLVIVAMACSSDDGGDQLAAAAQLASSSFQLDSANFQEKVRPYVRIPGESTCYGTNSSPPLAWTEVPEGTGSFALIAEDTDHYTGAWTHWVLYNIPADVTGLAAGIPTSTDMLPDGTMQGANDYKSVGYNGPCPPPIPRIYDAFDYSKKALEPPHRYYFRLYALDAELALDPGATRAELESAMEGHILFRAETMGKYTTPVNKLE